VYPQAEDDKKEGGGNGNGNGGGGGGGEKKWRRKGGGGVERCRGSLDPSVFLVAITKVVSPNQSMHLHGASW